MCKRSSNKRIDRSNQIYTSDAFVMRHSDWNWLLIMRKLTNISNRLANISRSQEIGLFQPLERLGEYILFHSCAVTLHFKDILNIEDITTLRSAGLTAKQWKQNNLQLMRMSYIHKSVYHLTWVQFHYSKVDMKFPLYKLVWA